MSKNKLGSVSHKGSVIDAMLDDTEDWAAGDLNSLKETSHRSGGLAYTKSVQVNGSGATTVNLFSFTGIIQVRQLFAHITAKADNDACTDVHFNINDGTNDLPLTKVTTGTLTGCEVGTTLIKNAAAATVVDIELNTQIRLDETLAAIFGQFVMVGKVGVTNYLQLIYTGATGFDCTMDVHIVVDCLCDSGSIVAV